MRQYGGAVLAGDRDARVRYGAIDNSLCMERSIPKRVGKSVGVVLGVHRPTAAGLSAR